MLRQSVRTLLIPMILTYLFCVAGCGGRTNVAEQPQSLAKTSDKSAPAAGDRTAKDAGTVPSATSAAAAPPAETSVPPAVRTEPIDVCQFAKVLDLRKLSLPEGATAGRQSPTRAEIAVPLAVPAAVAFFCEKLDTLGWKRAAPAAAGEIADSFGQVSLQRDGYVLMLTAIAGQAGQSNVTIQHGGNFDSRSLPRIEGAEDQYSNQTVSLYFTSETVDKATAALQRLFKTDGWQEYDRAFSQKAVRPDASDLLFRKKGYSASVTISKSPAKPDKSAVQYSVTTLANDLPAPADAGRVEIDDSRWILMCNVPREMSGVAGDYRKAMRELGFVAPPHETPVGSALTLSFESPDRDLVVVSLSPAADRGTKVKLEGFSASFREAMKKAEAADRMKREAQEKAEAEAKAQQAKASQEASKREDALIDAAIGDAIKGAAQPKEPSDLSKKIQADVNKELEKAFQQGRPADSAKPR